MKISVTENSFKQGEVDVQQQVVGRDFCCDHMMMAFADELIGYGHIDEQPFEIEGDERHLAVNIYQYDSESEVRISKPISFCPFCGGLIEIEHN